MQKWYIPFNAQAFIYLCLSHHCGVVIALITSVIFEVREQRLLHFTEFAVTVLLVVSGQVR